MAGTHSPVNTICFSSMCSVNHFVNQIQSYREQEYFLELYIDGNFYLRDQN